MDETRDTVFRKSPKTLATYVCSRMFLNLKIEIEAVIFSKISFVS